MTGDVDEAVGVLSEKLWQDHRITSKPLSGTLYHSRYLFTVILGSRAVLSARSVRLTALLPRGSVKV
jgi:hypothetical protein